MDTAYNNALMRPTLYYKVAGCCNNTLWMGSWQFKKKDLGTSGIIKQNLGLIFLVA